MCGDAMNARKIQIQGIVQGVGFRPFIYQLAEDFGIGGEVANTSSGVTITAEGSDERLDRFIEAIPARKPPLSQITDIQWEAVPPTGHGSFQIVHSRRGNSRDTLISPDVSICEDCLRELFDPDDRRFGYPFINCTNCGPRYTIINDVPYDRPFTSMHGFIMCAPCQREYDDPANRRFHAQPNACPDCGPRLSLHDGTGDKLAVESPLVEAAAILKSGRILAIKGLGGFHLAVDPANADAVTRLRQRKHREEKPFALMAAGVPAVHAIAEMTDDDRQLLESPQRPIVLMPKKPPNAIVDAVAPRNRYFGVMLPYTPLHYLLMAQGFDALVMTSANLSEEPICIDNDEAFQRLSGIADHYLVHDRDIVLRSDDSILRRSAGDARFLRRSRGYVPVPVFLKTEVPPVLACGAMLKNTVCLTRGNQAFVSQHVGDLENAETAAFFEQTIEHLKRILDVSPEIIAHDLHPDYLSTQYALQRDDIPRVGVQHHHAHIVSAMAEHRIDGDVIGLSFDGTGYGSDGKSWGGEVLLANHADFRRAAHMEYVPMPGSNAAVKEPWRMALGYLDRVFGEACLDASLPMFQQLDMETAGTVLAMARKGFNAPETSSLGRLFDAVAAIAGVRHTVRFEGQAAMELEMAADRSVDRSYDFGWKDEGDGMHILTEPIIRGVVNDVTAQRPVAEVSMAFHNTLVRLFTELCTEMRGSTGLDRVVMSGGVFQNAILMEGLTDSLEKSGFTVYSQKLVPANDGGISLGQAVIAAAVAAA